MKVYISADMEGTSGVVHSNQTEPEHAEYPAARKLMIAEVNAAIEGAFKGGATDVLVNDSHDGMRNLSPAEMHPDAILLSGSPKPYSMMSGIDATYDAVFCTGYHARAGSELANLDHTWDGPRVLQGVWLNQVEVGEIGLNAALAGHFSVPIALFTGDQTACAQAQELLGDDLHVAVVKEAVGRVAAKCLHPTKACALIRESAERALARKRAPFVVKSPITLRVALARSSQAEMCVMMPGVQRVAPRVVEFTHDDFPTVYNAFRVLMTLGSIQA
ncbi:MAG: M55 family metallopeptidase [Chloroflexi bacterium]|nr:M55 family metallopeptidase [Chloroflexota bacterium]